MAKGEGFIVGPIKWYSLAWTPSFTNSTREIDQSISNWTLQRLLLDGYNHLC
jgi:hypothetical protein